MISSKLLRVSEVRTNKGVCNVCRKNTHMKCTVCNLHCCFKDTAKMASVSFSMDLHNEKFFGLLKCDRRNIFGETLMSYRKPMTTEVRKNASHKKNTRGNTTESILWKNKLGNHLHLV